MTDISIISMTPMIGWLKADRLIASALISNINTTIQQDPAAFMPLMSAPKVRSGALFGRPASPVDPSAGKEIYS
jgi:hypothetical protein